MFGSGTSGLEYLLGDHLGSTSVRVNADGSGLQVQGYLPWGETRFGGVGTEYQYTGQYRESSLGLDWFNSRFYDPMLGRFAQADTMIPGIRNSHAWDRYSFSFNNPLKYSDPSGHDPEWLEFLRGAATQFTNDMTLGLVDAIADTMDVCLDCDASSAYEAGEEAGRAASSVVSSTEAVLGTAVAARAARPTTVIHRKVISCFRSRWEARTYAAMASVIDPAELSSVHAFDAIQSLLASPALPLPFGE